MLQPSLVFSAACLGLLAIAVRAQDGQLDIQVRSALLDQPSEYSSDKSPTAGTGNHGRVYAIVAVQLIKSDDKIVRPVDAHVLMDEVRHELDTHGFRQAVKGQKPDILLTVQYGRAWLTNPYFGGGQAQAMQKQDGDVMKQDITGDIKLLTRLQAIGAEAKAQRAQYEKLLIKITAWEYTTDPKAHAKRLWHTLMITDDPDHRDLNTIAAELLAAGAPYFDRETKDEEVDVTKPLPEGHVNVGTPEVVEPATPKTK
jgi:hypothetical protein